MSAHKSPRRNLSQSAKAWELQDRAASLEAESWADWARSILEREARKALEIDGVLISGTNARSRE